jgi:ferredoxin
VRVHVDRDKCQGHNRCYALAPELFEIDDYGYSSEVNDGVVPVGLEEKARLAVANDISRRHRRRSHRQEAGSRAMRMSTWQGIGLRRG